MAAKPRTRTKLPARAPAAEMQPVADAEESLINRYNNLVKQAELGGIQLVASKFNVKPTFYEDREPNDLSFNVEISKATCNREKGVFAANFNWVLSVKSRNEETLKYNCNFLCFYEANDAIEQDVCDLYMRRVGKLATYPYFRTLVSHTSWNANANLPVLPVLKSFPKKRPGSSGEQK